MLRSTAPSSFFSTSVNVAICALGSSPMMDFLPTSSSSSRRHSSCCRSWSEICCARRASRDSGRTEMEEATLRAKIQAMKNLLEAKKHTSGGAAPIATSYSFSRPNSSHYQPRKYGASGPVNRSWNRHSPPAAVNRSHVGSGSANKVWKREDTPVSTSSPALVTKLRKRPMKVTSNKRKSMQLQVLRLEDGEYAKANGGFSLVRAGVKTPTPATTVASAKPTSVIRSNSSYCKNKEECRFIHDSRRVSMCRKFLKNECDDPNCLLSHQHDE
ncbi:uncharacterized protein PITG_22552, partial [Phytophthora infestans T30-4]